eukprot:452920-Rhodomonas_salina.2
MSSFAFDLPTSSLVRRHTHNPSDVSAQEWQNRHCPPHLARQAAREAKRVNGIELDDVPDDAVDEEEPLNK